MWEHFCPGARRFETVGHHLNDCLARKPTKEFVIIWREGAVDTNILRTVEQNESQIQVWSMVGSEKQQCRVLRVNDRRCVQSAR